MSRSESFLDRTLRSTGESPVPCTRDSSSAGVLPAPYALDGSVSGSPEQGTQVGAGWCSPDQGVGSEGGSPQLNGLSQSPVGFMGTPEPSMCVQHSTEQGLSGPTVSGNTGDVPLRRSTREVRRPTYLRDYVSCGQTVQCGSWQVDSWQFRVHILLQLMSLFPVQQCEILNTILYVITHFG